jgi:hypothetical protein
MEWPDCRASVCGRPARRRQQSMTVTIRESCLLTLDDLLRSATRTALALALESKRGQQ